MGRKDSEEMTSERPVDIQFFALRRSGHHAVINWMVRSQPGLVVFRNDRILRNEQVLKSGRVQILRGRRTLEIPGWAGRFVWQFLPVAARIENFEDAPDPNPSGARQTVFVIRDFFNNMASRLK